MNDTFGTNVINIMKLYSNSYSIQNARSDISIRIKGNYISGDCPLIIALSSDFIFCNIEFASMSRSNLSSNGVEYEYIANHKNLLSDIKAFQETSDNSLIRIYFTSPITISVSVITIGMYRQIMSVNEY